MRVYVKSSYLCCFLVCMQNWVAKLFLKSKSSFVVKRIVESIKHSYLGSLGNGYVEGVPFFLDSSICSMIHKIFMKIILACQNFLDILVRKLFKISSFPEFMKNKIVRYRLTVLVGILVLGISLFTSNKNVLIIGFVAIISAWVFLINYSWLTYFLAAYGIIDVYVRKNLGGLSGIWDELFMLFMFVVWLYKAIRYRKEHCIKQTPINSCLCIFFGIFVILLLFSPNFTVSFEGFRTIVQYTLWYFLVLQLLSDKKNMKNLLLILVLIVGGLAIHGVYQYLIGVEMPAAWIESGENIRTRVYSIFTSPNIFGSLNLLVFPIAFAMCLTRKNQREKLFFAFLTLCMLASLVFTYSRGAWIGAACAVGVYVLIKRPKLIFLAVGAGTGLLLFVPSIGNRFLFMFSSDYLSSSMKGGRLIRWITALQILKEHPEGLGLGQFGGAVAMNHNLTTIVNGTEIETFYMDNYYLKIAVEAGVLGLLAFIWLMYQVITISIKTVYIVTDCVMKELAIGVTAGLAGVVCHNFVENVFEVPMMSSLFWMLVAVIMQMWYIYYGEKKGRINKNVKN